MASVIKTTSKPFCIKPSTNEEFFKAFTNESKCNLHIENIYGKNNHHIIESCFKAFAKSVRVSIEIDNRIKNIIPSSKGLL